MSTFISSLTEKFFLHFTYEDIINKSNKTELHLSHLLFFFSCRLAKITVGFALFLANFLNEKGNIFLSSFCHLKSKYQGENISDCYSSESMIDFNMKAIYSVCLAVFLDELVKTTNVAFLNET